MNRLALRRVLSARRVAWPAGRNLADRFAAQRSTAFLDFDSRTRTPTSSSRTRSRRSGLPKRSSGSASLLDLNYYLPCRVANPQATARDGGIIGLGRTDDGDFLSSEDMELLEIAGRLHRHRDPERAALRAAGSRRSPSTSG